VLPDLAASTTRRSRWTSPSGPADADAILVLTSATHGIEGYCGSGAQVGLAR
jgi:hypothetical protein